MRFLVLRIKEQFSETLYFKSLYYLLNMQVYKSMKYIVGIYNYSIYDHFILNNILWEKHENYID